MRKEIKREVESKYGEVFVEVEKYVVKFYSEEDGRLVCEYNMKNGKVKMFD